MSLILGVHPRVRPVESKYLVVALRAYVIGDKATEEAAGGGADCHSQKHGHWIVDTPIANPSSYSQDLKTSRKSCERGKRGGREQLVNLARDVNSLA